METELITDSCVEQSKQGPNKQPAEEATGMKKCPFCAEQIQAEAIKCRYCGEYLDGFSRAGSRPREKKWYFSTSSVVIALLCVGPLALPLVWFNPRYKAATKLIITVIVLVITVLCTYLAATTYQKLLDQITALGI
jgi:hypothetical protein